MLVLIGSPNNFEILKSPVEKILFFTQGALDVKPVPLILGVVWRSAGPYSGPPQHVVK
jgi:hypothetical protein